MKRKLAYINPDCFLDTDMSVLPGLAKAFDVIWIPLISHGFEGYSEEELTRFAKDNGLGIRIVHSTQRLRSLSNLSFFFSLVQYLNQQGYNLVFSANNNPYWFIAALFLKAPLVCGIHDFTQHSGFKKEFLHRWSSRLGVRFNHFFVFYSEHQKVLFKKEFPHKTATTVGMVPYDFGNSHLSPAPIEDGVKLLFFGRIDSYKGLDILIHSLESLFDEGVSNLTLSICGRGPFWPQCAPLIIHKDRFNLQIRFIENTEIPDLFSSHHFLVLPYRDTTQSGPLMIAIRYNLPVIVPEFPSFMYYCNSQNALTYPVGMLTQALKKSAELTTEEYLSIKNRWGELKGIYNEERIINNYIQFFNEICP